MRGTKLTYIHWTRSRGVGGNIIRPEDFVVREIIERRFFRKFSHSLVKKQDKYFLYVLKKKNLTTKSAIDIISRKFNISRKDIGFAGLKDKFAVTEQYITTRHDIPEIRTDSITLAKIKSTDRMMFAGDLVANNFEIRLHGARPNKKMLEEIASVPMPNYFGLQRFGRYNNNHIIGRHIVKRKFGRALEIINKNSKKEFSNLREIRKDVLKLYIHAYQSFLFNEALNKIIREKINAGSIKIVGFKTKMGASKTDKIALSILNKEGVAPQDFSVRELSLSCAGSSRKAFVRPENFQYSTKGDTLDLKFTLPKGSYATVLVNEIRKVS